MKALKSLSVIWGFFACLNLALGNPSVAIIFASVSIIAAVCILVILRDEQRDPSDLS